MLASHRQMSTCMSRTSSFHSWKIYCLEKLCITIGTTIDVYLYLYLWGLPVHEIPETHISIRTYTNVSVNLKSGWFTVPLSNCTSGCRNVILTDTQAGTWRNLNYRNEAVCCRMLMLLPCKMYNSIFALTKQKLLKFKASYDTLRTLGATSSWRRLHLFSLAFGYSTCKFRHVTWLYVARKLSVISSEKTGLRMANNDQLDLTRWGGCSLNIKNHWFSYIDTWLKLSKMWEVKGLWPFDDDTKSLYTLESRGKNDDSSLITD